MRVVGVDSANDQRDRGQDFRQRRMLAVQAHVELLQIADAGADMRYFVNGDRLPQAGAARKQRHECEKENCRYKRFLKWLHRTGLILILRKQMIYIKVASFTP